MGTKLGERIHSIIYRLRGGIDVAAHDVEETVKEVTAHINDTVVPAVEAKLAEVIPDAVKKAVSEALQFEREEAQKVGARLEEIYRKLMEEHGQGVAAQAMAEAVAPDTAPAPVPEPTPEPAPEV